MILASNPSYTVVENEPTAKKVLIIDDHPVFRRGIAALIGEQRDLFVCGEAENALEGLEAVRQLKPDVALIDISMPGTNGIELIKMILAEDPKMLILVLSMHDETLYALRALRAGAKGYIMKGEVLSNVITALRKVLNKDIYISQRFNERLIFDTIHTQGGISHSPVEKLSDREIEVLQWIGKGHSTRQIAHSLHLSVKTIETHRAHIKEKLGFRDSGEMTRFATEWVTEEFA